MDIIAASNSRTTDDSVTITIDDVRCRLCASSCNCGVSVFSNEAKKLQSHIKQYLSITISMDDKLSKLVCPSCCKAIEDFHVFAVMAAQSQVKLITESNHMNVNDGLSHKGLLHAYLTKEVFNGNDHDYVKINQPPANNTVCFNHLKDLSEKRKKSTDTSEEFAEISKINSNLINSSSNIFNTTKNNDDSDSNSHETLEVVLDPLQFLMGSSSSCDQTCTESENSSCDSFSYNLTTRNNHIFVPLSLAQYTNVDNIGIDKLFENNNIGDKTIATDENGVDFEAFQFQTNDDDNLVDAVCPICGKANFTDANLKMHLRIHRPKGKYECDTCKRIFKSPSSLLQHKGNHNRVQFKCDQCGRVYPTKSTLKAHLITHSDLRSHKCQLCDKSFKRNQDLKFHMNLHTGARPYKCLYCPKDFASSGNCYSHRKRMHPDEVARDQSFAATILC